MSLRVLSGEGEKGLGVGVEGTVKRASLRFNTMNWVAVGGVVDRRV